MADLRVFQAIACWCPIHIAIKTRPSERDGSETPMLICKHADNAMRWKDGERVAGLFEQRGDQLLAAADAVLAAVVTGDAVVTFRELDARANQTARFLLAQGLKSGDRIGLMFDKTVDSYVALLAVLKINAAYVRSTPAFPPSASASS